MRAVTKGDLPPFRGVTLENTLGGVSPRPGLSRTEGERAIAKSDLNF